MFETTSTWRIQMIQKTLHFTLNPKKEPKIDFKDFLRQRRAEIC